MVKLDADTIEGFVGSVLLTQFDQPTPIPDFHRDLWRYCTSDRKLVAIAAPRGHAKSTAITHSYVLAAALFRDRQYILIVSDTETQATQFLSDIKKELQTNTDLIELFGVKRFVKDAETDVIVEMDDGYCFRIQAKGSEQRVRGLKWAGKRPDLIVGDDLENDEIVMNPERREKFRRWFWGALLPCRAPHGIVRIVGTILHNDALLERLMPRRRANYPLQANELKEWNDDPKALWYSVKYRAHNPDFSAILWPTRFPKEHLLEIRQGHIEQGYPDLYSQEYLNVPLDESVSFYRRSDFIKMTEKEKADIEEGALPLVYYCGADFAISTKEKADFSVFMVFGMDADKKLYHIRTIRERMDGKEIVDTLLKLQVRYDMQFFALEEEKIKKSIGSFLNEEAERRGVYPTIKTFVPQGTDKRTRARSWQARMRMGTVKFNKDSDDYPILEEEFLQFDRGVHDDQVDACSYLGLALDKFAEAPTLKDLEDEEFEDNIRLYGGRDSGRSAITGY